MECPPPEVAHWDCARPGRGRFLEGQRDGLGRLYRALLSPSLAGRARCRRDGRLPVVLRRVCFAFLVLNVDLDVVREIEQI